MAKEDPMDLAAKVELLKQENAALTDELARTKAGVAAEKGPAPGTACCYQREGEPFCRPARIVSEGFTEVVPGPGGSMRQHALIEWGEPSWVTHTDGKNQVVTPAHTFQSDRHYDPMGEPNSWHLPDRCPRQGGPGCPYAKKPVWPPPRVEAP